MHDEHDDDQEMEVDEGAEIETDHFADEAEDDELDRDVAPSDLLEEDEVDVEHGDASDTI